MKTIKATLLAVLLLFAANTLMAQVDYQYAVISYVSGKELVISINGTDLKKIDIDKNLVKDANDCNPALREVNKMESDGWELFDTTPPIYANVWYFFLRKKVS